MAERRGKIITYNPTNRQGTIRPEDNGPATLFYINNVSNPEPAPKSKDVVVFQAPEPRKNKRGKIVQDQAVSVTIEERAPELTAEQIASQEKKKQRERAELRRTFLEARKNGGMKKPERRGKGRKSDKGKGKGKGRSRSDGDKDKVRKPRGPSSRDRSATDKGPRKASDRKARPKSKKPSIQSKIRYPMSRDIPRGILHMEQSNPGLVFDKFLQWPGTAAPLKKSAKPNKQAKEDSPESTSQLQKTENVQKKEELEKSTETTDTTAPTRPEQDWKLSGKHRQFFLSRTVAPLYRNYERKTLPWSAVRARREAMLRSLEHCGYSISSEIIKGPWRFAVSGSMPSVLDEAPISFQRTFSYPTIPAANLQRLLLNYFAQCDSSTAGVPETVVESFRRSLDRQKPDVIVFDAVPTNKIVQFTIERSWCSTPQWQKDGNLLEAGERKGRRLYALCTGDDAGFSLNVAAKEPAGQREISKMLLGVIAKLVQQANEQLLTPGSKEEKKFPGAVLY